MRVGILGTGFGAYHAELYKKMNEVEEITVFGRNLEKLEDLKSKLKVHITTDINEVLENKSIDLIDICLPSALHREYAIKALEHGKHVFCETPVAYTMEDVIAMQTAKEESGKQLMVDLIALFEPGNETFMKMLNEGDYGDIRKIQIQRFTPPIWGDLGINTIVTDLMIHDIDFVTYLLGAPNKIQADKIQVKERQSAVSAFCTYDTAFAEINGSSMMPSAYPFSVTFEVFCDKAVYRYYERCYQDHEDRKLILYTDEAIQEIPLDESSCHENAIRYAIEMIQTQKEPINDISTAMASLETVLKIKSLLV